MTQTEYSRHRGLNKSSVCRLAQRGILVLRGTLVDVAASDAVLDDRPAVEDSTPAPASAATIPAAPAPQDHGAPSYAQARVVDMTYRARLRRLEFEKAQGKLIDAEAVKKQIADANRALRDGMLAIPGRVAPVCAAEMDAKKIESLMLQEIKRELERQANAVDAI